MAHKIVPMPKIAQRYHELDPLSTTCELHGVVEGDISPCSHFDHCERQAVVWIYDEGGSPKVYGFCQQCYDFCYPSKEGWYRVVKVAPEFTGKL